MASWLLLACAGRLVSGSPRRVILTGGAAVVATGVLGLEAYMRAPLPLPSSAGDPWAALERLLPPSRPESLVLVFPGLAGPDANSATVVAGLRRARKRSVVVELDWRPWVGGELRGAGNGRALGAQLGRRLAAWASEPATGSSASSGFIRNLHFVGISVGSQAADAACNAFADGCCEPRPPHRQLTLLDPFTASGLVGLVVTPRAFGVLRFGERADYAEAVLNRDDPVPSTNLPLRCAVTYDVTRAAARASFTPLPQDSLHSWPVAWYGANAEALLARVGPAPSHSVDRTRERGAVVLVP